jgi:hypothetical protein
MSEEKPFVVTAEMFLARFERKRVPGFDWSDQTEAGHFRRLMAVENMIDDLMVDIGDGKGLVKQFVPHGDGWIENPEVTRRKREAGEGET